MTTTSPASHTTGTRTREQLRGLLDGLTLSDAGNLVSELTNLFDLPAVVLTPQWFEGLLADQANDDNQAAAALLDDKRAFWGAWWTALAADGVAGFADAVSYDLEFEARFAAIG